MFRNRDFLLLIICISICGAMASILCFRIDVFSGAVCLLGFACAAALFISFIYRRYRRIAALSEYIRSIIAGRGGAEMPDVSGGEEGEMGMLKDDIRQMASRLTEQAFALEGEKKILRDWMSDVSHQLKTPLMSLSLMAEMLCQDDLPPEKRDEFTRGLKTGISRMEWLVLSLLKFARIESDAAALSPTRTFAGELLERAIRSVGILLDVKEQSVDRSGMSDIEIYCDAEWSAEALGNILKNAGEHSPHGSVIRVASGENPIAAWISVTDAGAGIDPGDMPHIFRRFHRSEGAAPESMGVGLAMALAIMRRQDGDIEVKNESGSGASFTLKFYKTDV